MWPSLMSGCQNALLFVLADVVFLVTSRLLRVQGGRSGSRTTTSAGSSMGPSGAFAAPMGTMTSNARCV